MREDFCTAVKILLQRMETHPEEFYEEVNPNRMVNSPKWGNLLSQVVSLKNGGDMRGEAIFLTEAEKNALYKGYVKLRRKALDDYVMREVLSPEEDKQKELSRSLTNSLEKTISLSTSSTSKKNKLYGGVNYNQTSTPV